MVRKSRRRTRGIYKVVRGEPGGLDASGSSGDIGLAGDSGGALSSAGGTAGGTSDTTSSTAGTAIGTAIGTTSGTGGTTSIASRVPLEIARLIAGYLEKRAVLLEVSKLWRAAALPFLYAKPNLTGRNFRDFVDMLMVDKSVGEYVLVLDLASVGSFLESKLLAKAIRRCSQNLKEFVAGPTKLGFLSLVALRNCGLLRKLDLSMATDKLDPQLLASAITELSLLRELSFPMLKIEYPANIKLDWPPKLETLNLCGLFPASVFNDGFPTGLKQFSVYNCEHMGTDALQRILKTNGPHLRSLKVTYPMSRLAVDALDCVLRLCPKLESLYVDLEYISQRFFDPENIPEGHPLERIALFYSGGLGLFEKIKPSAVLLATEKLACLNHLYVSVSLGWDVKSSVVLGLAEALEDRGGALVQIR